MLKAMTVWRVRRSDAEFVAETRRIIQQSRDLLESSLVDTFVGRSRDRQQPIVEVPVTEAKAFGSGDPS